MEQKTIVESGEQEKTANTDKNLDKKDADELIDFYLKPEFIKIISQQIADQKCIDHNKIETIKAGLKNGTLTFNNFSLAEKIIAFENKLFDNNKL